MNNTYTSYPLNPRYSISSNAVVIDTMTGAKVPIQYTPSNKQYVRLLDDDGTYHTVYMVYMLAITFKGARPSIYHHATLINPRGCYCAANVQWLSEKEAKAKKIKIEKIKKILEAKTLD